MYGKEPWSKGKTKYDDDRLYYSGVKISKYRLTEQENLSEEEKNQRIGKLSLAANKARKDTKIEIIVMQKLEKMNIEFTKNYRCGRYIFDFYLNRYNFVVECQGDYWHGNREYFNELNDIQLKNIERDKNKIKYLEENNIKSLFLWENEIYRNKDILEEIILNSLNEKN